MYYVNENKYVYCHIGNGGRDFMFIVSLSHIHFDKISTVTKMRFLGL